MAAAGAGWLCYSLEVAVGTVFQQLYHLPLDGAQVATDRGRERVCMAVTAALWISILCAPAKDHAFAD